MVLLRTPDSPRGLRSRRVVILAGAALMALFGSAAARLLPVGSATPAALRAPVDTVTIYGPRQFDTPNGRKVTHIETFSPSVISGKQYFLRFTSGAPDGTHRATGGGVNLNGATIIAGSEFTGAATITRVVQVTASDTIQVEVSGTAGAYVTVSVLSVPDPTFVVFGPRTFTRGTGQPFDDSVRFTLPAGAGAPQTFYISNGYPDGSHRTSSAVVTLNGVPLIGPSDLNQQVSALVRTVTLSPSNLLEVEMRSAPGSVLIFTLTATDTTPPVIVMQTPTAGLITKQTSIVVTGTVTDQTATTVTVNGAPGTVTPGAPGTINFSATVPLTNEGSNAILVTAIDAAGNRTDSTRTVIRDTHPPQITITAPVDRLFTNADSVTISGTVTDLTAITANINGVPITLGTGGTFSARVALTTGVNFLIVAANDAAGNTASLTRTVTQDKTPPVLALTAPLNGLITNAPTVAVGGTVTDASAVTVSVSGVPLTIGAGGVFGTIVPLLPGVNLITATATDAAGNSASASRTVIYDNTPPIITIAAPANASTTTASHVLVTGTITDASAVIATLNGNALALGSGGAFSGDVPLVAGSNTLTVRATDAAGNVSTATRTVTRQTDRPDLPVDPATIAPPLDRTVVTSVSAATAFIYAPRERQIQTGVVAGTIDPIRATVMRGRVLAADLSPLDAVVISVLGHPEFGQTKSRLDGMFDMVVNGGGSLTLAYAKTTYLPAQRQVTAKWQDYSFAPDVVLLRPDTAASVITLGGGVQVARASVVSDEDGARQATVLFPAGTTASLILANGTVQSVTSLTLRATEFTVGAAGPLAMPAILPPTSQYTYAVNVTADEATTAGATAIVLNKPAAVYVDNFLQIPVGSRVPVGAYDPAQGMWVAQDNGLVIKVLTITGGVAQIDANGDGVADSDAALAALGIDVAERTRIATLFAPGTSFSRVATQQLQRTLDLNYAGYFLGVDPAVQVAPGCAAKGRDIIKCDIQRARQSVGVAGTPFSLNYTSANTEGGADRTLSIPLTGATLPDQLIDVRLEVFVAGQRFTQTFAPTANQTYVFTWDGKDVYGRTVQGTQPATLRVGYSFPEVWQLGADATRSFGLTCSAPTSLACSLARSVVSRSRSFGIRWQEINTFIGGLDAKALGLGGFMMNAQHVYDPARGVLYTGDGQVRVGQAMVSSITSAIGTGSDVFSGLNGPAKKAGFPYPLAVAVGPDGSTYVASAIGGVAGLSSRVFRVRPDGVLVPFAGNGATSSAHFSQQVVPGEEGPATDAVISQPRWLDVGPDGSVYIVDGATYSARVLRVTPDGILHRVAGGPNRNNPVAVGQNATNVFMAAPWAIAVGPDGAVYFTGADGSVDQRVWRVGTDSTLSIAAGTGAFGFSGDGGPATSATFTVPRGLAVGPDGSLYITDDRRVRRVTPDGLVRTVAGNGIDDFSHQGLPATESPISFLRSVKVAPDGTLYIGTDEEVFIVTPNGILNSLAGFRFAGVAGDGGPARAARFAGVTEMALTQTGDLLIADPNHHEVRRIAAPMPGTSLTGYAIASADGRQLYGFDAAGRHLVTRDVATGKTLYAFGYDAGGRLVSIADVHGQVTRVERDGTGLAIATVAPTGQRTTFTLGANSVVIAGPGGVPSSYAFDANGLLLSGTDENGHTTRYGSDAAGRLTSTTFPDGSTVAVSAVPTLTGAQGTLTPPSGVSSTLSVDVLASGAQVTSTRSPEGLLTQVTENTDGSTTTRRPDGTVTTSLDHADPRSGMQAPLRDWTFVLPSGLTWTRRAAATVVRDDFDDLITETDSMVLNGKPVVLDYNRVTGRGSITTPGGRTELLQLDANGLVVRDSIPGFLASAFTYDSAGRLSIKTQGSRTWQYGYDTRGRLTTTVDPLGRVETFVYDDADRLVSRTAPGQNTARQGYDAVGEPIVYSPATRPPHQFSLTSMSLPASYLPPDIGDGAPPLRSEFDQNGNLSKILRASGDTVAVSYDAFGRRSSMRTTEGLFTFAYDTVTGAVRVKSSPIGGSITETRDGPLPTRVAWSGGVSGSLSTTYNSDFRPITTRVNDADPISLTYDSDFLVATAGALTITRSPGSFFVAGSTLGSIGTTVTRDPYGAVRSLGVTFAGNSIFNLLYARDSVGRIVGRTETVAGTTTTFAFGYDSAGRLAAALRGGVAEATFEFDANGNRQRAVTAAGVALGQYDARDRLVAYGGSTLGYTLDGDLAFRAVGADTTRYRFSALGELIQVQLPTGARTDYVVDADGRRIGKRINGVLTRGWLYDGDLAIVAELDAAGLVSSRFVYGDLESGKGVPDYMLKGGQTYALVKDEVGSVRIVVNATSGAVAQRLDYDAFGRVTLNTNPGFQPFGFAGGLYDDDTKLTHFGARDYDAETGRWISRDPLLFEGNDDNLYVYVGNDPINARDPSGLLAETELQAENERQRLRQENYKQVLQERANLIKKLCKVIKTVTEQTAEVHHVLAKVLGGEEGPTLWVNTPLHSAYHSYLYALFGSVGLRMPNAPGGAPRYARYLDDPRMNALMEKTMLKAAKQFDAWCAGGGRLVTPGEGRGGIGAAGSMYTILKKYFRTR